MSNAAAIEPTSAKAERTRATILAAAEDLFSRRGFDATRLEDVAEAVQLTRAALFYYYKDKQTLYDAMLQNAFGPLAEDLEALLNADNRSIAERIESATGAWVDAIVARPTLARLILRIVADGSEQAVHGVFSDDDRIAVMFWSLFQQGMKKGELHPLYDDPFHAASAIVGTSVFYVSALAALVPRHGSFEPLDPKHVAAHKQEMLRTTRRLLGIADKKDK